MKLLAELTQTGRNQQARLCLNCHSASHLSAHPQIQDCQDVEGMAVQNWRLHQWHLAVHWPASGSHCHCVTESTNQTTAAGDGSPSVDAATVHHNSFCHNQRICTRTASYCNVSSYDHFYTTANTPHTSLKSSHKQLDSVAMINALPLYSPQCHSFKVIHHMAPFCNKQHAIHWHKVMSIFQIHSPDVIAQWSYQHHATQTRAQPNSRHCSAKISRWAVQIGISW